MQAISSGIQISVELDYSPVQQVEPGSQRSDGVVNFREVASDGQLLQPQRRRKGALRAKVAERSLERVRRLPYPPGEVGRPH